jgi:hypothetical protein
LTKSEISKEIKHLYIQAIKNNHTNIIRDNEKLWLTGNFFDVAVACGNINYLNLVYEKNPNIFEQYDPEFDAVENNQIKVLEWLKEKEYQFTSELYYSAMECDNYIALHWLISNNVTMEDLGAYEEYPGQKSKLLEWMAKTC